MHEGGQHPIQSYDMISPISHYVSKPDIMFSVCLCARFQNDPRKVQLIAVKRIFRYLIGTPNLDMCFRKGKAFRLLSYCDVDYVGDKLETKNTIEVTTSLVVT